MIGQYARSIAGHDKGQLYVIVSAGDDMVSLSDGRLKKIGSPKIKKIKHIELTDKYVGGDVLEALRLNKSNVNELIRLAIKQEERNV